MKGKPIAWKYGFAFFILLAGLILNLYDIGNYFLGFNSVGTWLVYIGLVMIGVITLQTILKKKRIVDERMEFVALKAARITFILLIAAAFVIMIIDGITPISTPYHIFMSYLISFVVFSYFIAYKILLRYY